MPRRRRTRSRATSAASTCCCNNAGVSAVGDVVDATDDEWERVFDVNVFAIARLSRALLPAMRAGGTRGAIVNTCSVVASVGLVERAVYGGVEGSGARPHEGHGRRRRRVRHPRQLRLAGHRVEPLGRGVSWPTTRPTRRRSRGGTRRRQPLGRMVSCEAVASHDRPPRRADHVHHRRGLLARRRHHGRTDRPLTSAADDAPARGVRSRRWPHSSRSTIVRSPGSGAPAGCTSGRRTPLSSPGACRRGPTRWRPGRDLGARRVAAPPRAHRPRARAVPQREPVPPPRRAPRPAHHRGAARGRLGAARRAGGALQGEAQPQASRRRRLRPPPGRPGLPVRRASTCRAWWRSTTPRRTTAAWRSCGPTTTIWPMDDAGCIRPDVVASWTWQPVEVRAGEALWFHSRTPHRSGPNRSVRPRRALYPTYNAARRATCAPPTTSRRRRARPGRRRRPGAGLAHRRLPGPVRSRDRLATTRSSTSTTASEAEPYDEDLSQLDHAQQTAALAPAAARATRWWRLLCCTTSATCCARTVIRAGPRADRDPKPSPARCPPAVTGRSPSTSRPSAIVRRRPRYADGLSAGSRREPGPAGRPAGRRRGRAFDATAGWPTPRSAAAAGTTPARPTASTSRPLSAHEPLLRSRWRSAS